MMMYNIPNESRITKCGRTFVRVSNVSMGVLIALANTSTTESGPIRTNCLPGPRETLKRDYAYLATEETGGVAR